MLKSTFNSIWRQVKKTTQKVVNFIAHGCEVEDVLVIGLVVLLL